MPIGASGRILNEMCSSRICIDEYHCGEIKGRIYNNYYSEPLVFENAVQMVKLMENLFDHFEYPQKTIETRRFGQVKNEQVGQIALMHPVPQENRGERATFYVKVIFRKHATWQGTVLWIDKDREENFRSMLELLLLIDSAMEG